MAASAGKSGSRLDIQDWFSIQFGSRKLNLPAGLYLLTLHEAPAPSIGCRHHHDVHRLRQGSRCHTVGTWSPFDHNYARPTFSPVDAIDRDFVSASGPLTCCDRDNEILGEVDFRPLSRP